MICSEGHAVEVMNCKIHEEDGHKEWKCPICHRVVKEKFDPYKIDLFDYFGYQCYNCLNLDQSEHGQAGNGEQWEVPGRCLEKGHRIIVSEMPKDGSCEHFRFRREKMFLKLMEVENGS